MGITSVFRRYIDYQTENDQPIVYEIIYKNYYFFPKILGFYLDIKTTKGLVWTILINLFHFVFVVFHIYLFVMTTLQAFSWSLGYSMQSLNYVFMLLGILSIMYVPITKRRKLAGIHFIMATDMIRYDEEVISRFTAKLKTYVERVMKYLCVLPLFLLMAMLSMSLMLPKTERYVNGIDLSLPIGMWYPFYIDTTFRYVLVVISQLFLCHLYISVCVFTIICTFACNFFALLQLMRLNDSINGIQLRATELMKKRYSSNSVKRPIEELFLDEAFAECYLFCLKENFEHYKIIQSYLDDFLESIRLPFIVMFMAFSVVIGSGMFTLMGEDFIGPKINAGLIGVIQICSSFVVCFIGQKITDYSEAVRESVYGMQWPGSHRKIQIFVKIFMLATTRPIEPAAYGLIGLSLNAFAGMTDVAYKSYNLLIVVR